MSFYVNKKEKGYVSNPHIFVSCDLHRKELKKAPTQKKTFPKRSHCTFIYIILLFVFIGIGSSITYFSCVKALISSVAEQSEIAAVDLFTYIVPTFNHLQIYIQPRCLDPQK